MNLPPPTLRLDGVRLDLGGFTLEVNATVHGRATGIFGPSGAGKTSLLEVVAGLRPPARGRVELGGRLLGDAATGQWVPPEQRRVGYVPQEGALFPHLSVRGNLLYGHRAPDPDRPPGKPALTPEAVVAVLEIGPLLGRSSVAGLSGGERQRVALGRALLSGPELLLLDEPLAGLDAGLKDRLLPYLARVRDELAVPMLYVTHAPAEVMTLCDEVLLLGRGRLVAQGAPDRWFEPRSTTVFVPVPRAHLPPEG